MEPDRNDGKAWSDKDLADLDWAIEDGWGVTETAEFLCRSGTEDEVAAKMGERRRLRT